MKKSLTLLGSFFIYKYLPNLFIVRVLTLFKHFNTLSLDVVAGACISAIFVAEVLGVNLHWATIVLLGLTVWLIYTFDHLNDARQITHRASTSRHRFHQLYFKELTVVSVVVMIAAAFLVFQIPVKTVVWGAALSCLVIAYFLLLFLMKVNATYHKEIMIALLYAAGVMLAPISIYNGSLNINILLIFSQFALLAFTNLLTFAVFEIHTDEKDSFPSLARLIGEARAILLLKGLVIVQLLITLILSFLPDLWLLEGILALMIALLGSIIFLRTHFIKLEAYRIVGDAIFLVPLVGILVS